MEYRVELENFEGPLDLLLYLIKKNDMDIHDVQISSITNEYLEYVKYMQVLNIESAGEFMLMASTLMYIKSKKLLPGIDEGEEETAEQMEEDLKQRLIEYKRFKEASKFLKEKEVEYAGLHYRDIALFDKAESDYDVDSSIFDIVSAFKQAYKRLESANIKEISAEPVSVEERMEQILNRLLVVEYLNVTELFRKSSKIELIVTFLALLELIRIKKIQAMQNTLFSDIRVYKAKIEDRLEDTDAEEFIPASD